MYKVAVELTVRVFSTPVPSLILIILKNCTPDRILNPNFSQVPPYPTPEMPTLPTSGVWLMVVCVCARA